MNRRKGRYNPGPNCAVCGMKRINVRHDTTPESRDWDPNYYRDMIRNGELHEFVPESPEAPRG